MHDAYKFLMKIETPSVFRWKFESILEEINKARWYQAIAHLQSYLENE